MRALFCFQTKRDLVGFNALSSGKALGIILFVIFFQI